MVADGVTDGEIILAIAIRPIPGHAATATIAIGVAKDATGTKVLVLKVGMTAVVAMTVVTEVVHVVTARAVAAVRDDRTRMRAVSRVNAKPEASIETVDAARPAVSTVVALVATKVNGLKAQARTATKVAGMLRGLPVAVTKGNTATRSARVVATRAVASTRMRAMIAEATSTVATLHGRTRASRRTISATGAERRESREAPAARRGATGSKVPKRTATDPTVSGRNAMASVVAVVDADAVDAAAAVVARVEIARWADRPQKAVGQKTHLSRRLRRCRRLTVATNMAGAKANTTVVVRVAKVVCSRRPSVT
jgi:hypothetical protein